MYNISFCSIVLYFLFTVFISLRLDLNLIWSFFKSVILISPSSIFSKRLRTWSNPLNFVSVMGPLNLDFILSGLTLLFNFSSFLWATFLNIYFCFEINRLSLSSSIYFFDCFNLSVNLNCFHFIFSLILIVLVCFSKAFPKG